MRDRFGSFAGIIGSLLFTAGFISTSRVTAECGAEFRVIADRNVYARGATAHIKMIATNASSEALYLLRGMSDCSSQLGTFSLVLFDTSNHEVNESGCSVELSLDQLDLERELRSSTSGIMLKPGEIYGIETDLKLPVKRGVYTLHARLVPAAIGAATREALASKGIRLLNEACVAPVLKLEVR